MKKHKRTLHMTGILWIGLLVSSIGAGSAHATWSIMAVDRATGEIGIAGASCTFRVHGIGKIVPGRGAVVVQAMSNNEARKPGIELLRQGASPQQIIEAMRHERFDPENQQYGVVVLQANQSPATYSGKSIHPWSGARTGDGVVVMGSILFGETVVDGAFKAFHAAEGRTLAERLVAALVAGGKSGGDRRCGKQQATSAFVTVFKPKDHEKSPYLEIVVNGVEEGGPSAVKLLDSEFSRWRRSGVRQKSTRMEIMP